MALALSLVQVGGVAPPGIQVTVSGLSGIAGAATVSVKRTQDLLIGSQTADVRGISMLPVTADSAVTTDYEFSFLDNGDNILYAVFVYNAAGAQIATTSVSLGDSGTGLVGGCLVSNGPVNCVIRSVETPALNAYVEVNGFNTLTFAGRILGTYQVLGRQNPVVLRDTMGGRSGQFTVQWRNDDSNIYDDQSVTQYGLEQLFLTQGTILLQPMFPSAGISDMYCIVGDISSNRITLPVAALSPFDGNPVSNPDICIQYTVTFTEVDRPLTAGEGTTISSWQDVLSNPAITTWADVNTHWSNWLGVLNDPSL